MRCTSSLKELPVICLPHQDEEIPPSAFPNSTTSKLAGLFSTLSLMLSVKQEAVNTNFKDIGWTRFGIKATSTAPKADALPTRPCELAVLE